MAKHLLLVCFLLVVSHVIAKKKMTCIGYVMMQRERSDSFSFHKVDTQFSVLIHKKKIVVDYKPIWAAYNLIARRDSSKADKSHVVYYIAMDNNSNRCSISFHKDESPEYFRVDYADSFKVYYVM